MTALSLIKLNNFFTFEMNNAEKKLSKSLIKMGLIPNKKFKLYSRNFCGGVVVGDDFFKIAFDGKFAKNINVSEVK